MKMKIRICILVLLVFSRVLSYGQVVTLQKEARSVPIDQFNKKYVTFLNKKYNEFIKNKYDSILLVQVVNYNIYNYSIIIAKKDGLEQAFAYKQSKAPDGEIKTFKLNNDTLEKISIGNLFEVLENDYVRTTDTTRYITHEDYIYCRFFFGKIKKLYMGYYNQVMYLADPSFGREYVEEANRLLNE